MKNFPPATPISKHNKLQRKAQHHEATTLHNTHKQHKTQTIYLSTTDDHIKSTLHRMQMKQEEDNILYILYTHNKT